MWDANFVLNGTKKIFHDRIPANIKSHLKTPNNLIDLAIVCIFQILLQVFKPCTECSTT